MGNEDLFGDEALEKPEPETFELPDGSRVSESHLEQESEETQIAAMRSWFFDNFQDPVHETPYDSREGGYIYLHGGPYNAKEELTSRFDGVVPEEIINKLADELTDESWEWEGRERYDDYILDTIAPPSEHIERFTMSIANIRKLVETPIDPAEEQFFRRMLYASVITALETYLSDRFVSSITNNPEKLRKFVETFPRFKKESIKVSDTFKKSGSLEREVKLILLGEILWHRLIVVANMFHATFGVDFPDPKALAELLRAVEVRHDLVHRSGKNKDGAEHTITPEDIEKVVVESETLVKWIDCQHEKFIPENRDAAGGEAIVV
jgi:RiboL-PSP-HEPN